MTCGLSLLGGCFLGSSSRIFSKYIGCVFPVSLECLASVHGEYVLMLQAGKDGG